MDLPYDTKDDDFQDMKKSHKKPKVAPQVVLVPPFHASLRMSRSPGCARATSMVLVQELPESASQCTICLDSCSRQAHTGTRVHLQVGVPGHCPLLLL